MKTMTPYQISSTITIMWDGKYWMALFERRDALGYSVAKATISVGEPQGYQVEKFLNSLDRAKLQFTLPGEEPTTTKTIIIEKKQKFEKTHSIEVALKNPFGDAKTLLQKQKNENKTVRREKENIIKRDQNQYKQEVKLAKKVEKHKGR
jgi:Protein of unknown function (DUF2992)